MTIQSISTTKLYYIQNKRFVGNCLRWWRIDGHGYTSNLDEAWKVTKKQALQICSSRPKEDFPRIASKMDKLAQRHVDWQSLPDPKRRLR
jgi:hypothetical protein